MLELVERSVEFRFKPKDPMVGIPRELLLFFESEVCKGMPLEEERKIRDIFKDEAITYPSKKINSLREKWYVSNKMYASLYGFSYSYGGEFCFSACNFNRDIDEEEIVWMKGFTADACKKYNIDVEITAKTYENGETKVWFHKEAEVLDFLNIEDNTAVTINCSGAGLKNGSIIYDSMGEKHTVLSVGMPGGVKAENIEQSMGRTTLLIKGHIALYSKKIFY